MKKADLRKYKQLVVFDPTKMGTMKGFSLKNSRLGFGIVAKFATANQAMFENIDNHSLHPLDTIPEGCSVPVFDCDVRNNGYGNVMVYHNGKYYQDGKKLWRKPKGEYQWGEWLCGEHIVEKDEK